MILHQASYIAKWNSTLSLSCGLWLEFKKASKISKMELYTQKPKYSVPLGKRKSVNNVSFFLCL